MILNFGMVTIGIGDLGLGTRLLKLGYFNDRVSSLTSINHCLIALSGIVRTKLRDCGPVRPALPWSPYVVRQCALT